MCYRLYTEASFSALREAIVPEILRCNLATAVLQLKVGTVFILFAVFTRSGLRAVTLDRDVVSARPKRILDPRTHAALCWPIDCFPMQAVGVHDILGFDFMDRPPRAALGRALEQVLCD